MAPIRKTPGQSDLKALEDLLGGAVGLGALLKFDTRSEAGVVAIACSPSPPGRSRWSVCYRREVSLATVRRYADAMLKLSINIDVDNLEKGVAFYIEAFGLTPLRRFGTAVELGGAQAPVYILQKAQTALPFPNAETRRDYARHWTLVHVDLMVDNLEHAVARALKAGARAESQLECYRWGRMVLMADPFGNGFCLIQLDAVGYEAMVTPY